MGTDQTSPCISWVVEGVVHRLTAGEENEEAKTGRSTRLSRIVIEAEPDLYLTLAGSVMDHPLHVVAEDTTIEVATLREDIPELGSQPSQILSEDVPGVVAGSPNFLGNPTPHVIVGN